MSEMAELQSWYVRHCDGRWEHSYGVDIETVDNPGWAVKIDLAGTELQSRSFDEIRRGTEDDRPDWLLCFVRDSRFEGHGGPNQLEEILRIFLNFAGRPDS